MNAVRRTSPAMQVGFLPGDILLRVNGVSIERVLDIERILDGGKSPWNISIKRGKEIRRIQIR